MKKVFSHKIIEKELKKNNFSKNVLDGHTDGHFESVITSGTKNVMRIKTSFEYNHIIIFYDMK